MCLCDVLKLMASAVSMPSSVFCDSHFCESCHSFLSFKASFEVKLVKHESLQKQVSSSEEKNRNKFYCEAWIPLKENIGFLKEE